ncbi:hypothetical protein D3C80_1275230 [compost metagenome]
MFGLFELCLEALAVAGQLHGHSVHVAHAQFEEPLALFGALPIGVLPTPDGREPLGDIHPLWPGNQGGEVAVEFREVEHRMIVAVVGQGIVEKLEFAGVEGLVEHGEVPSRAGGSTH